MKLRPIGIDLGTTNTLVAMLGPEGNTLLAHDAHGLASFPSAVLFADERTIVGREAQLRGRAHPDRFAACAKRSLGRPFYDHPLGDEQLPPEVIQAAVLRQVRVQLIGPDEHSSRAVIAVPAHFNATQRHLTVMAAEMAGIRFLDLVDEPIAAALAYAEAAPAFALGEQPARPNLYLVFDLGGYTFEATLLAASPGEIKMLATDHDSYLGGHDWDLRIADLIAELLVREQASDPRADARKLDLFMQRCAQVKHALTAHDHVTVHWEGNGKSVDVSMTTAQFEEASQDLVERLAVRCDKLLEHAGVAWSELRQILLVGGATRTPMIRRMLSRRLGRDVDLRVAPEEVVARGAAIYAAQIVNHDRPPPALQTTSLSTHGLGVEELDAATGERINRILIPQGMPLPVAAKCELSLARNAQHALAFNLLEGDDRLAAKCTRIGQVILADLPADVVDEWPVDVAFEYAAGGLLHVTAQARYTDRIVRLTTVRPGGVTRSHLDHWRQVIESQAGFAEYKRVRAWERAAESPPPVVVAGVPTSPSPNDPPLKHAEPDGAVAFLRRMMPFLFRTS